MDANRTDRVASVVSSSAGGHKLAENSSEFRLRPCVQGNRTWNCSTSTPSSTTTGSAGRAPPDLTPDDLPAEWRDEYRERAAIRELSGGLPRELAEHYALLDTLELMRNWDKYPTY